MASARCSGVPVARMSMGFETEAPGKSFAFSSSAAAPSSFGTLRPPFDRASVSITPGPPACVTMAKLDDWGAPIENTHPTVASSSREKQRTMPALRNSASTAESLDAMAPVCDEAARLPLSLEPALMAAILHPLRMSDEAWKSSLSGLLMFSIYSNFTFGSRSASKCSSMYCSTSSMPICLPLPIDHTELKANPLLTADSKMNTAVAPEPDMKSAPLGLSFGIGLVNTE